MQKITLSCRPFYFATWWVDRLSDWFFSKVIELRPKEIPIAILIEIIVSIPTVIAIISFNSLIWLSIVVSFFIDWMINTTKIICEITKNKFYQINLSTNCS